MRVFVLVFFCSLAVIAQDLQKGVVIPAVQFGDSKDNTYALYLPSTYDESVKYPIVFVFDDHNNGARTAQRFSIGANLTQSIIVAPNYTFSDSLNVSLDESSKLINEVIQRYAIDSNKILLAGQGRGAIVASTNGHLSENVAGIIAINDVFVDENILKKYSKARFVILNHDTGLHFYKLKRYDKRYSFREKLKGYYEFESKNSWPDSGYLAAAMVDLLQEHASQDYVQRYYESDMAFGESLYKKQRYMEAFSFTSDLKKQYKKAIDIKDQKGLLKTIRGNSFYKIRRLQRNAVIYDEQLLLEDFAFFLQEDAQKAYFDNLGWWNYQLDNLDTVIDSTAKNVEQRKSALRLKSYVKGGVEAKYELFNFNGASLEQLLFLNILRTLVQPDNYEAFLNVVSLSAKEGDENASLFYLEELLRAGYDNYDSLYTIDGTTALRISEEWNEVVKFYFGKSKYYDIN